MPTLSVRINLEPQGRIGPGKIELLEHIASDGSISAAARRMKMSYKHAWDLVEEMNRLFGKPLVSAQTGGKNGGGTELTPVGLAVVSRFRAIERAAYSAAEQHMTALQREIETAERRRGRSSSDDKCTASTDRMSGRLVAGRDRFR